MCPALVGPPRSVQRVRGKAGTTIATLSCNGRGNHVRVCATPFYVAFILFVNKSLKYSFSQCALEIQSVGRLSETKGC